MADVSRAIEDLEGPDTLLAALGPPRRLPSLCNGTPPSLAWTVRSCRRSRSRRTKVLRHFIHLNGRSLVSGIEIASVSELLSVRWILWRETVKGKIRRRKEGSSFQLFRAWERRGGSGANCHDAFNDGNCTYENAASASMFASAECPSYRTGICTFSGASEAFREAGVDEAEVGRTATLAPGMMRVCRVCRGLGNREIDGDDD